MKLSYLSLILVLSCACGQPGQEMYPDIADAARTSFCVASDDTALVKIFDWAVSNSNWYVGEDSDPVGPWYEAALPNRQAFCMRDVSHQCIGEELNGHGRQNANMMGKFVENISESKDYCSYWEIDRNNLPASADYVSDQDFWYNLNANFDVITLVTVCTSGQEMKSTSMILVLKSSSVYRPMNISTDGSCRRIRSWNVRG